MKELINQLQGDRLLSLPRQKQRSQLRRAATCSEGSGCYCTLLRWLTNHTEPSPQHPHTGFYQQTPSEPVQMQDWVVQGTSRTAGLGTGHQYTPGKGRQAPSEYENGFWNFPQAGRPRGPLSLPPPLAETHSAWRNMEGMAASSAPESSTSNQSYF